MTVLALSGPAGAAPSATSNPKVPALVADRVGKIRDALAAAGSPGAARLTPAQVRELTAGLLTITANGGIDLQVHATGPVGADQRRTLAGLGATILGSSADFAPVAGADLP